MKLRLLFILGGLLLCFSTQAQTTQNITPAHLKAAEDVLVASGAGNQLSQNVATMVKQSSANIPEDKKAKFTEVVTLFMNKYMNWELLKDQMAAMYASEFTEKELKDLTAFFLSPLGKKLNQKQPALFQKGAALGQQAVASHQIELQEALQAAFKGE